MVVFGAPPRHSGLCWSKALSRLSHLLWVVVVKTRCRKWEKGQRFPPVGFEQMVASRRTGVKASKTLGQLRKGALSHRTHMGCAVPPRPPGVLQRTKSQGRAYKRNPMREKITTEWLRSWILGTQQVECWCYFASPGENLLTITVVCSLRNNWCRWKILGCKVCFLVEGIPLTKETCQSASSNSLAVWRGRHRAPDSAGRETQQTLPERSLQFWCGRQLHTKYWKKKQTLEKQYKKQQKTEIS